MILQLTLPNLLELQLMMDWDDPLPIELSVKMMLWFAELLILSKIKVPRCIWSREEVKSATLHMLVDASNNAYGAVIYVRTEYIEGEVSLLFVASKTK